MVKLCPRCKENGKKTRMKELCYKQRWYCQECHKEISRLPDCVYRYIREYESYPPGHKQKLCEALEDGKDATFCDCKQLLAMGLCPDGWRR